MYDLCETTQSIILTSQARCLVGLHDSQSSFLADQSESPRFLVGCQSVKTNNSQVHLVTLNDGYLNKSFNLKSQSFIHPDGEVVELVTIPSSPLHFVSVYSSISSNKTELSTGARIWRLPSPAAELRSSTTSELDDVDFADRPPEQLEFVSSLPCDNFDCVKKIVAHPSEASTDLACVLGPPLAGTPQHPGGKGLSPTSSFLAILQEASGDYKIASSCQLRLPLASNEGEVDDSTSVGGPVTSPVNAVRWSPHRNAATVGIAFDSGVLGVDTRCMQSCFWLNDVHWPCVRDLDFNPNRDHILATGGDDGCVSLWDLRSLRTPATVLSATPQSKFSFHSVTSGLSGTRPPLISVPAHSHWIWCVRYHPTRDQLLVSASSDTSVCLYGLSSFSSESPEAVKVGGVVKADQEVTVGSGLEDGILAKLEQQHPQQQESVYAVDWSPVDPWIFAAVNYDGHLTVTQVPDQIKLGILLQHDFDEDDLDLGDDV